jgi:hypothetical protein
MVVTVDRTRVVETAERMVKRYSTAKVASEMAWWHSTDSVESEFWRTVSRYIDQHYRGGRN